MYKDTIVVGTTDSVQTTIDPADAYDYFGVNTIENVGAGLVDYRPGTTEIVPALATDWSVSSDGLTWTFNLRQGVKFPDGTAFDANVMKYTMDREFAIDMPEGPFAGVGYDTHDQQDRCHWAVPGAIRPKLSVLGFPWQLSPLLQCTLLIHTWLR